MKKNKKQINDFLDDWLKRELTNVFDDMWDSGKNESGHLGGELFERFGITYRDVLDEDIWDSGFLKEIDKQFTEWNKTIKN
ncbi:hypothetical protein N9R07_03055 [Flavobacteriaceae bacterium]|jgi:hypothetical protein|nr:hypothetical protein [Flavobacteriaceae bacterium]